MMETAGMSEKEREARWQAESDARTLAEAEVIKGDESRHGKAREAADRLAKEAKDHSDAMQKIADFYGKSDMKKPMAKES